MHNETLVKLANPFTTVLEKPGKGYKYVPSRFIIERMNEVFAGNWSTEVVKETIVEDQVLVVVRVTVTDPLENDGKSYFHDGCASHQIARFSYGDNKGNIIDLGNSYIAAISKAIKQACKKWGVATDLEEESDPTSVKTSDIPSQTMSMAPPAQHVPIVKQETVQPVPVTPTIPQTPVVPATPIKVTQPTMAAVPTPSVENDNTVVNQTPVETPMVATTNTTNGSNKITDTQKVALNGLLTLRNLNYQQLVVDAFAERGITKDVIPQPDDLDYDDAVVIIKYGNELFRKNK
jgi:hypothetical protein